MRSLRALMVLSLAALTAVTALASWYDRKLALRAAEDHVALSVGVMREQALNVLQIQELVLDQIGLRIAGLDWDAIGRSAALAAFLRETRERTGEISAIWLADPSGRIRASNGGSYADNVSVADRQAFRVHREGDDRTFIGAPHDGAFVLSRRWSSPAGDFDGVIAIEMPVAYFANFFRGLDEEGTHRAVLVRADGTVLAGDSSDAEPRRFPPGSELMRAISAGVQDRSWNPSPDGDAHFFEWRQLAPYGVYVAYAMNRSVALGSWYGRVAFYAFLAAGLWAGLCVIAYLSARRAAAEAALQQAQRMEAIGQLASGVAHDFNNLLTTVIGNLDRIALDERVPLRARRLADAALHAATRGASLTTQLLAFARRQPLNPSVVRVDRLVDAMLPLLRDAVGETVGVSCTSAPDLSTVRIDPGQFEAALLNLAFNARDAMPRGGLLRIEARDAILDAGEASRLAIARGDYVLIEVADTGIGMRADIAHRAFEPFFTTKEPGKGSGLGLSMVYGFARQSGGTAEVESRIGTGTTVRLYLPRSEPATRGGPVPSGPGPSAGRRFAILIVEDQEGVRDMIAESLAECGHEISTARAADEAVELLGRDARIDVLVTDIILPGAMTGADLVRKARVLVPELKVLAISGNADAETIEALSPEGCAFLRKPFRASDLVRAIEELV
ncbi:MAG TPA: ATP-binding protein [Stellaceae bacterium]|jgi:two-component system NtrC family sensor kinase|nr:ATP-binding protein [Stellaceae bacterium]